MIHFAIYTVATGQILYTGHSDASVFDILDRWAIDPDQSIALCEPELDQRQWRVVDGAVVARDAIALTASKTSFAADGVDEVTITGLPDPCTVTVAGLATWGPNEVLGGSLTLTATKPGDIRIIVARDPDFIAAEITLHAT